VPELLARIRVILRRKSVIESEEGQEKAPFRIGDLVVDEDRHRVRLKEGEIRLTPNEYKLLALLVKYRGKVLTHRFIIENVWGGMISDDTQSLRVCMGNLRRKLNEDPAQPRYIITEIGVGYRLADE
jgi:two-component system KDP operon response regulator KdpE